MYLKLFMIFSWVCDLYFWQTSNYEMSFPKGGDENPCILNNNDKLLISSFMSMDWKLSWAYLWFSSMYLITSNDNILTFYFLICLFKCNKIWFEWWIGKFIFYENIGMKLFIISPLINFFSSNVPSQVS
jgi:hypothetical protein